MIIKVYSKPNCVQCDATYLALKRKNLSYDIVDLTKDIEALSFIISLGYQQLPVVVVDKQHWSGFRPDMISQILNN
ncbi:MAG: glutaredoxin-like protein NrdH [Arsenophonus sp.]